MSWVAVTVLLYLTGCSRRDKARSLGGVLTHGGAGNDYAATNNDRSGCCRGYDEIFNQ